MVAMRDGFEKRRSHATGIAQSDADDNRIEAILANCIADVRKNMTSAVRKEREKLILLSDEAWLLIMANAMFDVTKVINFSPDNRKGSDDEVHANILAYEQHADATLFVKYRELCAELQAWRPDQEKKE